MYDLTLRALQGIVCEDRDNDDDIGPASALCFQVYFAMSNNPFPLHLSLSAPEALSASHSWKKSMRSFQTISLSDMSHEANRAKINNYKVFNSSKKSTLHRTTESASHAQD